MKIKFLFFLLITMISTTSIFASFPVERTVTEVINNSGIAEEITTSTAVAGSYDKWVALALWFFLGWPFAAHRWYAKKPVGINILYIITLAGLGIWSIIDLINILTDNF